MLDLKEEQRYRRLRRLAQELHIPMPEAFWTLEVFDKDGKVIQKHKQRSHSWTRNAYNEMFCHLASKNHSDATWEAGKLSMKKTDGVVKFGAVQVTHDHTKDYDSPVADSGYLTPGANINKGILVGSGTNAESFEDFVLQTPITEGVGAGQLNAVASDNHNISYGALVLSDAQVRYFNNNSGGNVSINEVALVDGLYHNATRHPFLMARDKLGATVTVPDTGQLKVTYTIQLTYPA